MKEKLQTVSIEINKSNFTLSDHFVEVNDMVQNRGQQERFYNETDHLVKVTEVVSNNEIVTSLKVDNE